MKKKSKLDKRTLRIFLFFVFVMAGGIFALGWLGNDVYRAYSSKRTLDGLWLSNYNESGAYEEAYSRDSFGDWVCVNIKGMTYERALEVTAHEVGHEIFAEECEKNIGKCLEAVGK